MEIRIVLDIVEPPAGRLRVVSDPGQAHHPGSEAESLSAAYVEGRLTKDDYDARLESALSAGTFAERERVVSDLARAMPSGLIPAGTRPVIPARTTIGLAVASFVCGLGQFVLAGPLATIPAIVLGHVARRQIQRTGQQGAGPALAGLVLGWLVLPLAS